MATHQKHTDSSRGPITPSDAERFDAAFTDLPFLNRFTFDEVNEIAEAAKAWQLDVERTTAVIEAAATAAIDLNLEKPSSNRLVKWALDLAQLVDCDDILGFTSDRLQELHAEATRAMEEIEAEVASEKVQR